jgi:uncharacterized protein YcbK (DUF882 family)
MDMTQLTPHFSLREMIRSDTAVRLNIDNTPTEEHMRNLVLLCTHVLEPVRNHFGPVRVNSGYRCLALNMSVNPMTSTLDKLSKHCTGQAVDFEVEGVSNADLAIWCRDNLSEYGQVILEFYTPGQPNSGWVHVSFVVGAQKKEVLTAARISGKLVYSVGINP